MAKYKAGDLIRKVDDTPFPDERVAAQQQGMWAKRGVDTEVIEEDDGWALKVVGDEAESGKRPKRVPLGFRTVLDSPVKETGYVQRFVNDTGNRIRMFEDAGWEVVCHSGKVGDDYVGNTKLPGGAVTKPTGHGITMVLMRKRKDWFDEDMAEKQSKVTRKEESLIQRAQVDNLTVPPNSKGIDIKRPGQ